MEDAYIEQIIYESENKELFVNGPLNHLVKCLNPRISTIFYSQLAKSEMVVVIYDETTHREKRINVTGNSLRAIAESVLTEL